MPYVAAVPAVGLLAGAAAGLLVPDLPRVPIYAVLITCGAVALWAWRVEATLVLAASVVAGFLAGGILLASDAWQLAWRPSLRIAFEEIARAQRVRAAAERRSLPEDDEAFAIVEGVLRADAAETENGVSLSIAVDTLRGRDGRDGQQGVDGGIAVSVLGSLAAERMNDWRAGRRVRLPVTLRRPSRYLDPGVPDHERALARRGTTLVGSCKSGALVELLAHAGPLSEAIASVRAFARRAIADNVGPWSARSSAIVAAIVIGDRAGLDDEVQRRLQEAGTYHVIAISGGNIAILAGLLLTGFRLAGWLGRTAMLCAIAVLLFYAALVGNGASVDRATLMAVVYFAARAADQRSPPLNILALVAALLVGSDPLVVSDPAFVLTFGATLAILAVVPAIVARRMAWPAKHVEMRTAAATFAVSATTEVKAHLVTMFAASLAVEALLFPIGALVFSRVTFAGLLLNFLAIPLMAVAQIAGMVVVPLAAVSRVGAAVVGWLAHVGAAGLVWSANLVRFAPVSTYRVAPPSLVLVGLYYGTVTTSWLLMRTATSTARSRSRAGARVAACVAAFAALWILANPRTLLAARGDGRLHVTFLDVAQGDSAFIVFPGGSTMLVDAGGLPASSSFDLGERVVAPVVRDAGFRRIDYLVFTHGDPDHVGGAPSIIREFRPREVWEGIPVPRFQPLTDLRLAAQAAGARWANVYRGDHVTIDDVQVLARHPGWPDWERQKVRNDDSLVLDLRWRDLSVLLTGDVGRAVERDIASATPPARLRVVKIPHHGSLSSSTPEFVAALRPTVAVASAGRANHFGHPVPEVLERYKAVGAEVFRTDRDGAVTVETDGNSLQVRTFTGRTLSVP